MAVLDFAVINDAPDVILDGDSKTSRIQVAKTGSFQDPRYGKFSITTKDFATWIKNFNTLSTADGHLGLPVDVDHSPEKRGDTEAVGWVTKLEAQGNELWGTVEWNSKGVELIADRRYAYISPSYAHNYKDETGKAHGTALVGVALTNRPFLNMATVSLSKSDFVIATELSEPADSREHMPDLSNIAEALGLSKDADEATILAKVTERTSAPPEVKSLDEQAKAEGKVVLDAGQVQKLVADATAGAAAAIELSNIKFDNAFNAAVEGGRTVPAMRDSYKKLYELDAETTLDTLANSPKVLNTDLQGSGAGGGEKPLPQTDALTGFSVDRERAELNAKVEALMLSENIDYSKALDKVLAGGGN